jgi:cytochrome c oxidase subunit IV
MEQTHSSVRPLLLTFVGLMILLTLTVWGSFISVGAWRATVAVIVAVAKALLVMIFFMHLRSSERLTWVVAAAGFFWLSILLVLTIGDFVARGPLTPMGF